MAVASALMHTSGPAPEEDPSSATSATSSSRENELAKAGLVKGRRRQELSPELTAKRHRYPTRTILSGISPVPIAGSDLNPSLEAAELEAPDSSASISLTFDSPIVEAKWRREQALERLSFNLVLAFCSASGWAKLRGASRAWRERLEPASGALEFMAFSVGLPAEPANDLLGRLAACERLASPRFSPPPPAAVLETPEGGGIWCLELHRASNLVFAGFWGPVHQVDLIKAWDAGTGAFVGSLYGHFNDVKCLAACGPFLWSGSYDGTMRCYDVEFLLHHKPRTALPGAPSPLVADKPVLALAATPDRLFSAHDDGNVRCWDAATGGGLWVAAHPGPVTALALRGDKHLVTASTCPCFNGSGFSLRVVERADGRYVRRLGDEDWSPRKTVTFMEPLAGGKKLLVGFGAPLATVATGAVAVEHEVAQVLPLADDHRGAALARLRRRKALTRSSSSSLSSLRASCDGVDRCPDGAQSVEAPAWGAECVASHGGNVAAGTDNGLVVVCDGSGSHRHRVLDVCGLAGFRPSSRKVTALCLVGTKVFVALQAAAGDRDGGGFTGKLLCFELVDGASLPAFT